VRFEDAYGRGWRSSKSNDINKQLINS
jgi:hypothetical protein